MLDDHLNAAERVRAQAQLFKAEAEEAYARAAGENASAGDLYRRADIAFDNARHMLDRAAIVAIIAVVFALLGVGALVGTRCTPRRTGPTMHSRRITAGGQTVTLEIPDGQCASALGVTVCVPPSPRKVSP